MSELEYLMKKWVVDNNEETLGHHGKYWRGHERIIEEEPESATEC